tara:strand:- start:626 stop:862 length:237 start_codon:yes stop_codon:yes gene_type:complete
MLISKYNDEKVTANQYAKELILDQLDKLLEGYWAEEFTEFDFEKGELVHCYGVTAKEIEKVNEQLHKRVNGVIKYLWK